jgi:NAD(P)-dependent dehydrogenase (short-subunit alcohol dehydrogenase family)
MNPTYDFKGQVALVTGAAMGMGLATARAFAQSGASVVLADRDGALAEKEAAKIVEKAASRSAWPATSPMRRKSPPRSIGRSPNMTGSTWRSTMPAFRSRRAMPPRNQPRVFTA